MVTHGSVKGAPNTALGLLGKFVMPADRELCSAEHAQPSPVPSPSFLHGPLPKKNHHRINQSTWQHITQTSACQAQLDVCCY